MPKKLIPYDEYAVERNLDNIDMPYPTRIAVQERLETFWRDTLDITFEELEDRMRALAGHALNIPSDVIAVLNSEKKYRAALKHWESYQVWKVQRNPARAKLEKEYGYDTKHAMHLIRLMRVGLEVLQHGDLIVRRPDADELNAIRDGALSFDELLEQADKLTRHMEEAVKASSLPVDIDRNVVDSLVYNMTMGKEATW